MSGGRAFYSPGAGSRWAGCTQRGDHVQTGTGERGVVQTRPRERAQREEGCQDTIMAQPRGLGRSIPS
jgi:hypothetical protein